MAQAVDEKIDEVANGLAKVAITKKTREELGQYFTTSDILKNKVVEFLQNNPSELLEPSVGQGDLVVAVKKKIPDAKFDMFEIDESVAVLAGVSRNDIVFRDFLAENITKKYRSIVGNPPYVKTQSGNLYIDFVRKCLGLLENNGELIFIVPADFLKLTSASDLLDEMMLNGHITDIFHPDDEKLFSDASINVIVFRYVKTVPNLAVGQAVTIYNEEKMFLNNSNGMITFSKDQKKDQIAISELFDVFVGIVSGKDSVFKNAQFGNIDVLSSEHKTDKFILVDKFPTESKELNDYLLTKKTDLLARKIRKFSDKNWFEWGALRNISAIRRLLGQPCIFISNLTRREKIAFRSECQYFGGSLIMLAPKNNVQENSLENIADYFNSLEFKKNFMFSGRFKIGHRQIQNSFIPKKLVNGLP